MVEGGPYDAEDLSQLDFSEPSHDERALGTNFADADRPASPIYPELFSPYFHRFSADE